MATRARKDTAAEPEGEEAITFEQAVEELQALIDRIEQGEIGLEESVKAYQRGVQLLKRCRSVLDVAEQEIKQMTAEGEPKATG